MYIYRCAKRGDFDKDCIQAEPIYGDNSHKYEHSVEYIHFFRYAKDAEYYFRRNLRFIKSSEYHVGYTVVEVDENEISKFIGYGIYIIGHVYFEDEKNFNIPLLEYAIPKYLYDEFNNKWFFKVKEDYAEGVDDETYYDRIPAEFRNDKEYDEYLNMVNELCIKQGENPELIGKEIAQQIGEEILLSYQEQKKKKIY